MRCVHLFYFVVTVCCSNSSDYYDLSKGPLVTHKVWFDITIGGVEAGRIVIGLFGRTVRDTVWNFVDLAKTRPFVGHRGGVIDYVARNQELAGGNTHCDSDYGETFPKENFKLKHYGAGWVAAISADNKTVYACTFYIILKPFPTVDGRNVVFGKIVNGMKVIRTISKVEVDENHKPKREVLIADCGTELADPPFRVARMPAID